METTSLLPSHWGSDPNQSPLSILTLKTIKYAKPNDVIKIKIGLVLSSNMLLGIWDREIIWGFFSHYETCHHWNNVLYEQIFTS